MILNFLILVMFFFSHVPLTLFRMEGQKCSKLLNLNQGDLQISGQILIKLKNLIASLMKMLELTNFGHMTTSWTEIT